MYQIIDPETHQPIDLYSHRINQLLQDYKEKDLLSLKIITQLKYNRNTIFYDDILSIIMSHLSFDDIKSLCQTDQKATVLCQNETFWEQILKRDHLYFEGVEKSLQSYDLLYHIREKINKMIINIKRNIAFHFKGMVLTKILAIEELERIQKEWQDDNPKEEFDDKINEFIIYKGYHPHQVILYIPFQNREEEIQLAKKMLK